LIIVMTLARIRAVDSFGRSAHDSRMITNSCAALSSKKGPGPGPADWCAR